MTGNFGRRALAVDGDDAPRSDRTRAERDPRSIGRKDRLVVGIDIAGETSDRTLVELDRGVEVGGAVIGSGRGLESR